jgi:hypothetical protein
MAMCVYLYESQGRNNEITQSAKNLAKSSPRAPVLAKSREGRGTHSRMGTLRTDRCARWGALHTHFTRSTGYRRVGALRHGTTGGA